MLTNIGRNLIYVGATSNLLERIKQHKNGNGSTFTSKYHVNKLVWFEEFSSLGDSFKREKQIKQWRKEWKWNLIKQSNPDLNDLYIELEK